MLVLRKGMKGSGVRKWQYFLVGQGIPLGQADGKFGDRTESATIAFQNQYKLDPDGIVGHQTLVKAIQLGYVVLEETQDNSKTSPLWPPRPDFPPLTGTAERQALFGKFSYLKDPLPDNEEHIKILNGWEQNNIVKVNITQLIGIPGASETGAVYFHKLAAGQLKALWAAWEKAGLLDRVLTYEGAFAPRLVRGSTSLSNHAFGTAFDINYAWNKLNTQPALVGEKGSVRELVPLANEHGFFWGGHYNNRLDGMHLEVAVLKNQ